jgi:hypothetical protein
MLSVEFISGANWWEPFLAILLLVFGLFLILAGLFTAYFGSGKSRTIGVGLLVVGIVMGILVLVLAHFWSWSRGDLFSVIGQAIAVILAAVIGALIAIAIFLLAIMKS